MALTGGGAVPPTRFSWWGCWWVLSLDSLIWPGLSGKDETGPVDGWNLLDVLDCAYRVVRPADKPGDPVRDDGTPCRSLRNVGDCRSDIPAAPKGANDGDDCSLR